MTNAINEIRSLLGSIDPALSSPAPRLHRDTILRAILLDNPPNLRHVPPPRTSCRPAPGPPIPGPKGPAGAPPAAESWRRVWSRSSLSLAWWRRSG